MNITGLRGTLGRFGEGGLLWAGVVVLKELICGGCEQFLLLVGVVVLKELIFNSFVFGRVWKELIFNSHEKTDF